MLLIFPQLTHAQSGLKKNHFKNQHCLQVNEMKNSKMKNTIIGPKRPACNRKIRRAAAGEHLSEEFKELGLQVGYMAIIY